MTQMVRSNCPACQSCLHAQKSWKVPKGICAGLTIVFCKCGQNLIWLSSEQRVGIDRLYGQDYAGFETDDFFASRLKKEFESNLKNVVTKSSDVIDVGCGNGQLLEVVQGFARSAIGVDMSAAAVEECEKRGVTAEKVDFLDHSFAERFDTVFMFDVLEHLDHPDHYLEKCREILNPGGALVLKIPTYGSRSFMVSRLFPSKAHIFLDAPAHMQFFSSESIVRLLTRLGFESIVFFPAGRFRKKNKGIKISKAKKMKYLAKRTLNTLLGNSNLYLVCKKI